MVVVAKIECRFHRPARYDDVLRLKTKVVRLTLARIEHEYELHRGGELLTEARIVLCCVDRSGSPRRLPEWMELEAEGEKGCDV
jgi:acyl-CoA thioester hydrolase